MRSQTCSVLILRSGGDGQEHGTIRKRGRHRQDPPPENSLDKTIFRPAHFATLNGRKVGCTTADTPPIRFEEALAERKPRASSLRPTFCAKSRPAAAPGLDGMHRVETLRERGYGDQ